MNYQFMNLRIAFLSGNRAKIYGVVECDEWDDRKYHLFRIDGEHAIEILDRMRRDYGDEPMRIGLAQAICDQDREYDILYQLTH